MSTDRKWMKFIIGQLLTNALKYTFEPNRKVYLTAECSESGILLTIRDEGIGIPASDLPRVTKAFFTGENGRKTAESTGMGLFLANEVCGQLGHEMKISSEPGQGTEVSILFPDQNQAAGKENERVIEN